MAKKPDVRVRRGVDNAEDPYGVGILVDRVWPRSVIKMRAARDEWCKDMAASAPLHKGFGHDPVKATEFVSRYRTELKQIVRGTARQHLRDFGAGQQLSLLTTTTGRDISEAASPAGSLSQ